MTLMSEEYNTSWAGDSGLGLGLMGEYFGAWPNADKTLLTESLMCLGKKGGDVVDDYLQARSDVCISTCPEASTKRASLEALGLLSNHSTKTLGARRIDLDEEPSPSGNGYLPTWTYMIQGLMDGTLTLVYEQLIYTNRGEQFLEIAWRIPSGDEGAGYRERNDDEYVVFHFHFEHLLNIHGTDYAGVYAMVAFHGQGRSPNSRVNGNDRTDRNLRAEILRCNTEDEANEFTQYWYPGYASVDARSNFGNWIVDFGVWLHEQDLVTARTFTHFNRGQLETYHDEDSFCPERRYFDWGGYTRSRQFTPGGGSEGDPSQGEDDQNDDDGV
ncbi:uncharacterized protein LDX57_011526 [Aspergillus melleus]|uniref:uncharacterized protein n=1 Tax=Aspergillus melleus TaxID=138277 RepID=UPI001E8EE742|nr:uncharacterized protein LDX57_011526 [Aspergillus melleus]KAH8433890.1 hypothetical protein LDX57_011526 [Aspergillus melleus]